MSLQENAEAHPELAGLIANLDLFSERGRQTIETLLDAKQIHLFENWETLGTNDAAKKTFVQTLEKVDASYPGGLQAYIGNAQKLLAEARQGLNPFEGFIPEQPNLIDLSEFNETYVRYEQIGLQHLHQVGFVLVAGGLGERLGYSGIKLNIPCEVVENTTYLEHYASSIKAYESRMATPRPVPFIIMTSQDTHAKTMDVLAENDNFGLQAEQIHVLKQELVPALADNNGTLALKETYKLILKPHGHGDIHMLLHTSGLATQLKKQGIRNLVFIQDTNGQVFNAVVPALGASIEHDFDFNSIAVNRIPGEAVGGLAKLVKEGRELTLNVEYNQLDPLLRATISPEGDVPNEKGYSIFPGNINVLVIKLESYLRILEQTEGIIAEFVNPKYADDEKTTFNKPTRLETMMQDLPKLFGPDEKVGVTTFNRVWCFSALKNNILDAAGKHTAGGPPEAAATAENDFYLAGRMKLEQAGMSITPAPEQLIQGIPFTAGPKALLRPSFAITLCEVAEKIKGGSLSDESTLILKGKNITLHNIELSGQTALVIDAIDDAHVTVDNFSAQNDGYELIPLTEEEMTSDETPEYLKIRGYHFENRGAAIYIINEPGSYTIAADGTLKENS